MTNTFRHSFDFMYFTIDGTSLPFRTSGGPSYGADCSFPIPLQSDVVVVAVKDTEVSRDDGCGTWTSSRTDSVPLRRDAMAAQLPVYDMGTRRLPSALSRLTSQTTQRLSCFAAEFGKVSNSPI